MKNLKLHIFSVVLVLICATIASAQVNVSGSTGANGTYATLKEAFDAINVNTNQSGNNILIEIAGDTSETATATLNQGGWATLTIQPSGARTVSGNLASPLIELNGADNVTINGLNTGGNSLTIVNQSTSSTSGTSTIRLVGDATNNTITNCTILGASTTSLATNGGTIWISTAASGGVGNDNNTISNNKIGPFGSGFPTKAIYANGSTTNTNVYNSGITISGNEIFDYFAPAAPSIGIYISSGNDNWTISGNKFYQTAARTQTSGALHAAIQVAGSTGNTTHTFTNNTIGYSSGSGTGTYAISLAGTSGRFVGIYVSSAGTGGTYNYQGNTVTAISVSGDGSGTGSTGAPFGGIIMASGGAANYSGNVVGSATTAGAISFTTTSTSTTGAEVYGIYHFPSTNCNMTGNTVAGINASRTTTNGPVIFLGLRAFTSTSVANTFTNNIVGTSSAQISVSSTNASSRIIGIYSQSGSTAATGNTVRNLTINSPNTGTGSSASAIGFWVDGASTPATHTLTSNQIENISNTNGTNAVSVTGIHYNGTTGTNIVQRNRINNITTSSTSASAVVNGIFVQAGTTTYRNNMISLGGSMSNSPQIYGVQESTGTDNFYYNSIYISGTATSGSANSWAFYSIVTVNTRIYRGNIFFNGRSNSGATGTHYAIQVGGTGTNPTGLTSNNNDLYVAGGVLGFYNGANRNTLNDWQTATGQDANSISADPQFVSATDLHISSTSPVRDQISNADGNTIGVFNDFDGEARPGQNSLFDIGADEFDGLSNDMAATAFIFPTNNGLFPAGVAFNPQASFTNNAFPQTNVTVRYRIIDSSNNDVCNVTATISSINTGQTVTVTFPSCTVTAGTYTIKARAELSGDQVPSNDEITGTATAQPPLSGSYTVGTGGNYTSLTNPGGIFEVLNSVGATGNVTINIISNLTNETGQVGLNQLPAGASVTIKPSGAPRTISSTATATRLIFLNGADNVTIDGSLTPGGTDRSLTLALTNSTTSGTTVVWVGSLGAGQGATGVTIKNTVIQNGTNFNTSTNANFGIFVGASSGAANGPDNDNLTIQNNLIQRAKIGIQAVGDASGLNDNMLIADNVIGDTATITNCGASTTNNCIGKTGIFIGQTTGSTVTRNIVRNIFTSASEDTFGIIASTGTVNTNITRNSVSNMETNSSIDYGATGITIATGTATSNVTVANNFVYDIRGKSSTTNFLRDTNVGIRITGGNTGGINVWNNSVNLFGNYAGFNGATITAAFMINRTLSTDPPVSGNIDVRNNVFVNTFDNTTVTTDKSYAIYTDVPNTVFSSINYNDYFVSGAQGVLGAINATDATTLSALQTATGQDANSKNVDPLFLSNSDLHLQTTSQMSSAGTSLSAVTVDYDGDSRQSPPDIGADEITTGTSIASGTYYNIGVTGGTDYNLTGNVTVTGYLAFNNTRLNTGTNTLTLGCNATVSGAGASAYVIGNVAKQFCTTGSFTYPIGSSDPNEYTPVIVNVTALGQNPSTLTASVTDAPMTGLNPSISLSRYWRLTESGDITADLTFQYVDEDVNGNESDYRVYRKTVTTSYVITNLCPSSPCVNTTANTVSVSGVTDFSDWSAGENQVVTAGPADVRGRVVTREGRGIAGARITVTSESGEVRVVQTNPFGYYSLRGLPSGQTYTFTVTHKVYRFSQSPTVRFIIQDEEINFTADELK